MSIIRIIDVCHYPKGKSIIDSRYEGEQLSLATRLYENAIVNFHCPDWGYRYDEREITHYPYVFDDFLRFAAFFEIDQQIISDITMFFVMLNNGGQRPKEGETPDMQGAIFMSRDIGIKAVEYFIDRLISPDEFVSILKCGFASYLSFLKLKTPYEMRFEDILSIIQYSGTDINESVANFINLWARPDFAVIRLPTNDVVQSFIKASSRIMEDCDQYILSGLVRRKALSRIAWCRFDRLAPLLKWIGYRPVSIADLAYNPIKPSDLVRDMIEYYKKNGFEFKEQTIVFDTSFYRELFINGDFSFTDVKELQAIYPLPDDVMEKIDKLEPFYRSRREMPSFEHSTLDAYWISLYPQRLEMGMVFPDEEEPEPLDIDNRF